MCSQRLAWLFDFGPAGVLVGFGLGFVSVGCFAFSGFGRWVCFCVLVWFGFGLGFGRWVCSVSGFGLGFGRGVCCAFFLGFLWLACALFCDDSLSSQRSASMRLLTAVSLSLLSFLFMINWPFYASSA